MHYVDFGRPGCYPKNFLHFRGTVVTLPQSTYPFFRTIPHVLLLIFLLGAPSAVYCDTGTLFDIIQRDTHYILSRPGSISRGDLVWMTSFSSLAVGLAVNKREVNEEIRLLLRGSQNSSNNSLDHIEFFGDGGVVAGLGAIFIIGGLEAKSQREAETGIMILESYFYTGVLAVISQFVLAEERPRNGGEMRFFRTDGHGVSGHAALAASFVCPVTHQYLRHDDTDGRAEIVLKEIMRGIVWGVPLLTGLSRIERDEHYAWNVALGLAAGYGMGHMVAVSHERAREKEDRETKSLSNSRSPGRDRLTYGILHVSYSF